MRDWVATGTVPGLAALVLRGSSAAGAVDQPQDISGAGDASETGQYLWNSSERITLLVMGIDQRAGVELDTAYRTDTMMLVTLANKGFYSNVIFHRVVPGFVIQGGDPTGTGTGGPGYKFDDEPVTMGYARGTVAMANAGPNTNGSQFFICLADLPQLPPNYTIFGQVVAGLNVVDAIAAAPCGPGDRPVEPVTMTSVSIR